MILLNINIVTYESLCACGCHRHGAVSDCVVLVLRFGFRQYLFVFGRFKRAKYIRLETINQINGNQYATQRESKTF